MKTYRINYKNEWKSIGDFVILKEKIKFLIWYLPIKVSRIYRIFFIGDDGGAAVFRVNSKMLINTPEVRDYAHAQGHIKDISGLVEIIKF